MTSEDSRHTGGEKLGSYGSSSFLTRISVTAQHTFIWKIEMYFPAEIVWKRGFKSSRFPIIDCKNKRTDWMISLVTNGKFHEIYIYRFGYKGPAEVSMSVTSQYTKKASIYINSTKKEESYHVFTVRAEDIRSKSDPDPSYEVLTLVCDLTLFGVELTNSVLKCPQLDPRYFANHGLQFNDQLSSFTKKCYLDTRLSDCKMLCQGEEYTCHTYVLAARSPVFCTMFTNNNFMEANTKTVNMDSMKPHVLKDMLYYMYNEDLPGQLQDETAEDLLSAADQYQIDLLKKLCEDKLLTTITVDRAVHLLILADMFRAEHLKRSVIAFMAKNMKKVVRTVSWREKLVNHPDLMAQFCLADKQENGTCD